jgi:hypothetical protein
MCNRYVQNGREVRPGQGSTVLMRGPGGDFEVLFDEAIFGGPARSESRSYWISREGAEPVLVPDIERFGEKDQARSRQNWEEVPAHSAMEGLLLPRLPGKDYRLLKVVTQPATAEQFARLGNDRVPIFTQLAGRVLSPSEPGEPVAKPELATPDQLELPI